MRRFIYMAVASLLHISCGGYEADYSIDGLKITCEVGADRCPPPVEVIGALDAIQFAFVERARLDCKEQWALYHVYFVDSIPGADPRVKGMTSHGLRKVWITEEEGSFTHPDVFDWELGNACLHRQMGNLPRGEIWKLHYRKSRDLMYGYGRDPNPP